MKLAEAYIRFTLHRPELIRLSDSLEILDVAASTAAARFYEFPVELDLRAELGSRKLIATILASNAVQIFVLYGSVRQSVDYLVKDARRFSEYVIEETKSLHKLSNQAVQRTERRLGDPGRLQRALSDIDELDRNPDRVPPSERSRLIARLKKVIDAIENAADRERVVDSFPSAIRNRLQIPPQPFIPIQSAGQNAHSIADLTSQELRSSAADETSWRLRRHKRIDGRPAASPLIATSPFRWIVDVKGDGEMLLLDDGSAWRVETADVHRSCLWLPSQRVTINETDSIASFLNNLDNGDTVRARQVS
jgi:hypothetical protein